MAVRECPADGEDPSQPAARQRAAGLRKRVLELRKLSGELEELARRGRKQARQRRESLSGAALDLDALCAYAARLRTGPPAGFPVTELGLPAEPLPGGFSMPFPIAQDELPKARGLWTGAGRAPPPEVEVLPPAPSMAGEADSPGPYSVVNASGVRRTAALDSEPVGTLSAGTAINVTEVLRVDGKRVRARVSSPAGWISLLNLETGFRWAERLRPVAVRLRALPPATTLFYSTDGSLPRPGAASARRAESGATLQLRLGSRLFVAAFAVGMRASDTVTLSTPRPPPAEAAGPPRAAAAEAPAVRAAAPATAKAREAAASGGAAAQAAGAAAAQAAGASAAEARAAPAKAAQVAAEKGTGAQAAAARWPTERAGAPSGAAKAKAKAHFRGGLLLGAGDSDEDEEEDGMDDDESSA